MRMGCTAADRPSIDGLESDADDFSPRTYSSVAEAMRELPGLLTEVMWVHIQLLVENVRLYIENVKTYLDLSETPYRYKDDEAGGLFLIDCTIYDAWHLGRYLSIDKIPCRFVRGPAGCALMLGWV
jgi:hypothetical protein